jgi:hypothetical protein
MDRSVVIKRLELGDIPSCSWSVHSPQPVLIVSVYTSWAAGKESSWGIGILAALCMQIYSRHLQRGPNGATAVL